MYYGYSKKAHEIFLKHYMPQKNKNDVIQKPKIFGNISQEEYLKKIDKKSFRWILSPESQLTEEELKVFANKAIEKLEENMNMKFDWQAVVHNNTGHPHVHILINGKNQNGKEFRIPPKIIKEECRKCSMDVLTELKGFRSEEQIKAARDNRPLADRYTEFDKELKSLLKETFSDSQSETFYKISSKNKSLTPELRKRLDHLRELGLANVINGDYILLETWEKDLQLLGRYNTYLEAKQYVDKNQEFNIFQPTEKNRLTGKIKHIYKMNDENVWSNAVVIEDSKGNGWYVPVYNENVFDNFTEGDNIDIVAKENAKGKLKIKMYLARTKEDYIKMNKEKKSNSNGIKKQSNANNISLD